MTPQKLAPLVRTTTPQTKPCDANGVSTCQRTSIERAGLERPASLVTVPDYARTLFARLLSDKRSAMKTPAEQESEQAQVSNPPNFPMPANTMMRPEAVLHTQPNRADLAGGDSTTSIRMGTQARMADQAAPPVVLSGANEPSTTWQATLPAAAGAELHLNATRHTASSPHGQAGVVTWSLAVTSPVAEAAAIARHTGRLTERLQEKLGARVARVTVETSTRSAARRDHDDER